MHSVSERSAHDHYQSDLSCQNALIDLSASVPGDFPTKEAVSDALRFSWDFLDVPLAPLSQVTYKKMRAQWCTNFMDEIAQYVAENAPLGTAPALRRFASTLPDVWQQDAEVVCGKAAVYRNQNDRIGHL